MGYSTTLLVLKYIKIKGNCFFYFKVKGDNTLWIGFKLGERNEESCNEVGLHIPIEYFI